MYTIVPDYKTRANLEDIKRNKWLNEKENIIRNCYENHDNDYLKFLIELNKIDYIKVLEKIDSKTVEITNNYKYNIYNLETTSKKEKKRKIRGFKFH